MLQVAPAAKELPHALLPVVVAKSVGFVPAIVIPTIVNAALPLFVRVTVVGALVVPLVWPAKATEVGASVTTGAGAAVPVPVNDALCGEPVALSATSTIALKVAAVAGVNVT
jgi:hypothetical protein